MANLFLREGARLGEGERTASVKAVQHSDTLLPPMGWGGEQLGTPVPVQACHLHVHNKSWHLPGARICTVSLLRLPCFLLTPHHSILHKPPLCHLCA